MSIELERSYARCEEIARAHYENFHVGSRLFPRDLRPHLYALYAFARTTDDLGDEAPGDRPSLLAAWRRDFEREDPAHPILLAVHDTMRAFDVRRELFLKLIAANEMDQKVTRHRTWRDLAHYCDHSANPCGRMVLALARVRDEESQRLSDATCTALQLTNFWQDVWIDYLKGRIYFPLEDMQRTGVTENDLAGRVVDDRFRRLMQFEIDRTRELFTVGMPLAERVGGVLKFDLRLFTMGGMRILDLIEKADCDVFNRRPKLTAPGKAWLAFQALLGRKPKAARRTKAR